MASNLPEPKSRKESYLAKAAGMGVTIPEKPLSRTEQYLAAIAEGGGGGGGSYTAGDGIVIDNNEISVDLAQSTGTSTTSVMSQNATTGMIYDDTAGWKVRIGSGASTSGNVSVALGKNAQANNLGSIALGSYSSTSQTGEMNIGTSDSSVGYNSTNYRLISGVHDPVGAHDAATKGYVDANAGGGAKELTTADYDYPDANPNGVALWRKDAGMYYWKQGVNVYISTTQLDSSEESAVVFKTDAYYLDILTIYPGGDKNTYTWYKVTASTGVGAAIGSNTYNHILSEANVASSTGTSHNDVMSQNATSSMVFADPSNSRQVKIGANTTIYQIDDGAVAIGYRTEGRGGDFVSIGSNAKCSQNFCVAVGSKAVTNDGISGAIALGYGAQATRGGEVNIGATQGYGYNSTNYRVLGGVHDGQTAHDAVTVEQVNATIDAINTALSTSIPHIGATS